MRAEEHKRFHEDCTIEDALRVIVDRELDGEEALDKFMAKAIDMIQGQTLTTREA